MKDRLIHILVAVLLLAAGVWLVGATEWVDIDTPTPARGDALNNRLYATEGLLRALGAKVSKHKNLDTMPPVQARLVLISRNWSLFPGREKRLKEWVQQGGQLIIPGRMVSDDALQEWLPVRDEKALKVEAPPLPRPLNRQVKDLDCRALNEPDTVPPSYADMRGYRACGAYFGPQYLSVDQQSVPLWSVEGARGVEAVRVRMGKGSVTVIGPWEVTSNSNLLRADNALLVTAALQAQAGGEFWVVTEEAREHFLAWLWQEAWPALLLGLLALAFALWRASARFGPLAPVAPVQRRSMAEQVRGTGSFLSAHGPAALHVAQLRALREAATAQLPRFGQMSVSQQTAEIARVTGLEADALKRAQADRARNPKALAADLQLLETARRRLNASQAAARTPSPSENADTAAVRASSP